MVFKKRFPMALAVLASLLMACSNDDGSSGTSSETAVTTALTTINGKLKAVSDLLGDDASASMVGPVRSDYVSRASGIAAVWETDPGVNPLSNSGTSTLQTWFSQQFNESFENSNGARITFAGRIGSTLDILCYLGKSGLTLDSATNLPIVGNHTMTMTSAMNTACGGGATDAVGESITLAVSPTTNDTHYDRLLSFGLPGSGACPFKYYARITSAEIKLAAMEDQNCDGRDHGSLSVVAYDVASKITRFFYISKAFDFPEATGFEIYRGYLNETTDEAYIVGFYGGDNDGDVTFESGVSFTAVGKPVAGGTVAVSAKSIGNSIANGEYQGCIDPTDMSVETDNSLNCTLTGEDTTDSHANVVQDLYGNFPNLDDIYDAGENVEPGFSNHSDIFN